MSDVGTNAVEVTSVSKRFRLYHERNQSLKAAFMRGRRAKFDEFWALQDVSLSVPTGKTYGLIDSDGSPGSYFAILSSAAKALALLDTDRAFDALVARWHIDDLYMLNPLVHFVEAFRDLLYQHQVPSLTTVAVVVLSSAASLVLGWAVFGRFSKRLAEEL